MSLPLSVLLLIPLPDRELYFPAPRSAVICADAKHEMLPFSSSTCEAFLLLNFHRIYVLRAEILSCQCTQNRDNIVLLIACLYTKCTATLTWHSGGDVTLHVVSNLIVCRSR